MLPKAVLESMVGMSPIYAAVHRRSSSTCTTAVSLNAWRQVPTSKYNLESAIGGTDQHSTVLHKLPLKEEEEEWAILY